MFFFTLETCDLPEILSPSIRDIPFKAKEENPDPKTQVGSANTSWVRFVMPEERLLKTAHEAFIKQNPFNF